MFSCFLSTSSLAQSEIPEDYFSKHGGTEVKLVSNENLTKILKQRGIYLDHGSTLDTPVLYITQEGLNYLERKNIPFVWNKKEEPVIQMLDKKAYSNFNLLRGECLPPMVSYPTYDVYEQMMLDFTIKYPDICQLVNIGTLNSGRKLLAIQISDSLDVTEHEPNFLYTSTMHGDELAGFPTMLMLIDHLLCNYGSDTQITKLIDNINIYINPLANPNGTYKGGNQTVLESTRLNAAFVDLNRNFPDPDDGPNPDNNSHQEETSYFMNFAHNYNIHLSCNIHSGKEFANYPWDTYEHLHADDEWWKDVCREYADTVQFHSQDGYFTDYNNGVSNGFEAFEISGSRQDYMNYYNRSREFTLELSDSKKLPSDQLPMIWEANKNALINYIGYALTGIRGTVLDSITKEPIEAEIYIPNYDFDNSSVLADKTSGTYYRYLNQGVYDFEIRAEKYYSKFVTAEIPKNNYTELDILLSPATVSINELELSKVHLHLLDNKILLNNLPLDKELYIQLSSLGGISILSAKLNPLISGNQSIEIPHNISQGIYLVSLSDGDNFHTKKLFIK